MAGILGPSGVKALINDLLNLFRLSHSDQEFRFIDFNTIIESLRNDFELIISQKEAQIELDPLPIIEAIPLQINQLFYHLIRNALKFTDTNRQPYIRIQCKELREIEMQHFPDLNRSVRHYRIDFIDNGVGFEQEFVEQNFDLFKRLHQGDSYECTGVGPALCKIIILNHHGKIFATSENSRVPLLFSTNTRIRRNF